MKRRRIPLVSSHGAAAHRGDRVVVVELHREHRRVHVEAGVVHEHVDAARDVLELGDQRLDLLGHARSARIANASPHASTTARALSSLER
jgi:hypothetical protein